MWKTACVFVLAAGLAWVAWGCRPAGKSAAPARAEAGAMTKPTTATTPAAAVGLTVKVTDLRNKTGKLRLAVFRAAEGFPDDPGHAAASAAMGAAAASPEFRVELPPGRYAVVVVHDEDDDGILGRNAIGIPKEGYGVSNNPKPRFRPARYDEATFTLPAEGAEMSVSLQYF